MHYKHLKVRTTPHDGDAFTKNDMLEILNDGADITPIYIGQERVDIVVYYYVCGAPGKTPEIRLGTSLRAATFIPTTHCRYLAERKVFICRTSRWIADRKERKIIASIEDENPNLEVMNLEFCGTDHEHQAMKLTFTSLTKTTRAATQGLFCCDIKIPPYQGTIPRAAKLLQMLRVLPPPSNKCQHPSRGAAFAPRTIITQSVNETMPFALHRRTLSDFLPLPAQAGNHQG